MLNLFKNKTGVIIAIVIVLGVSGCFYKNDFAGQVFLVNTSGAISKLALVEIYVVSDEELTNAIEKAVLAPNDFYKNLDIAKLSGDESSFNFWRNLTEKKTISDVDGCFKVVASRNKWIIARSLFSRIDESARYNTWLMPLADAGDKIILSNNNVIVSAEQSASLLLNIKNCKQLVEVRQIAASIKKSNETLISYKTEGERNVSRLNELLNLSIAKSKHGIDRSILFTSSTTAQGIVISNEMLSMINDMRGLVASVSILPKIDKIKRQVEQTSEFVKSIKTKSEVIAQSENFEIAQSNLSEINFLKDNIGESLALMNAQWTEVTEMQSQINGAPSVDVNAKKQIDLLLSDATKRYSTVKNEAKDILALCDVSKDRVQKLNIIKNAQVYASNLYFNKRLFDERYLILKKAVDLGDSDLSTTEIKSVASLFEDSRNKYTALQDLESKAEEINGLYAKENLTKSVEVSTSISALDMLSQKELQSGGVKMDRFKFLYDELKKQKLRVDVIQEVDAQYQENTKNILESASYVKNITDLVLSAKANEDKALNEYNLYCLGKADALLRQASGNYSDCVLIINSLKQLKEVDQVGHSLTQLDEKVYRLEVIKNALKLIVASAPSVNFSKYIDPITNFTSESIGLMAGAKIDAALTISLIILNDINATSILTKNYINSVDVEECVGYMKLADDLELRLKGPRQQINALRTHITDLKALKDLDELSGKISESIEIRDNINTRLLYIIKNKCENFYKIINSLQDDIATDERVVSLRQYKEMLDSKFVEFEAANNFLSKRPFSLTSKCYESYSNIISGYSVFKGSAIKFTDDLILKLDEKYRNEINSFLKVIGGSAQHHSDGSIDAASKSDIAIRWIPAGTFKMGDLGHKFESIQTNVVRNITITAGFCIAQSEITEAQMEAVMPKWGSKSSAVSNLPYKGVSWHDAVEFCSLLTTMQRKAKIIPDGLEWRLPTEAEWEYACRAGSESERYGEVDEIAWWLNNASSLVKPVMGKKPNKFGLYDMIGNLSEWCLDWYAPYDPNDIIDPKGPAKGNFKVIRGGNVDDSMPSLSAAARSSDAPYLFIAKVGFRPVLTRVR